MPRTHEPDEDELEAEETPFEEWVAAIPRPTPREIFHRLEALGYVGQELPRRAMSLMAHRHVRRLQDLFVRKVPRDRLPPKENHLLVGPTGCGKTFLVELLFRDILSIPTTIVDITTFSETGYVGQDVASILTRLLYVAEGRIRQAQVGVVCIDEFDKIAGGQNNAVFAGAGTTKDVSGLGVQRELLKLLERSRIPVPTAFDHSTYNRQVLMDTDDVLFVAAGAFSGLKRLSRQQGGRIGFGGASSGASEEIAVSWSQDELEDTAIFQTYGFLPELVGRFVRVLPFSALDEGTLRRILVEQVIPRRRRELELAGIGLDVDDAVLDRVVGEARRRQTGARGLASALLRHLEDAAFEAYSEPDVRAVRLVVEGDAVVARLD